MPDASSPTGAQTSSTTQAVPAAEAVVDQAAPADSQTTQSVAPEAPAPKKGFLSGLRAKWQARVAANRAKGEATKAQTEAVAPKADAPAVKNEAVTPKADATPVQNETVAPKTDVAVSEAAPKPSATPQPKVAAKATLENPPKGSDGKPDYSKLSPAEKKKIIEAEKIFQKGLSTIRDLIAPSSMEVAFNHLLVDGMFSKSFFVYSYPRYIETNWLSPVVNFDVTMDMAQFIYPISSSKIMKTLKSQVARFQSSIHMAQDKGKVRDPALETALEDAEQLRTDLQRGQEKFYQFAIYFTVYHRDEKKLEKVTKQIESLLGGKLVLTRRADLRMEHAFNSTLPMALDELEVYHNMNTSPLSTTFPFVSSDLTSNRGILYGLNRHNDGLIIFDRFSLENANSVVFAKSGAGKSYAVKLEILRSLMMGSDVIVIDPENEYEALAQTVGGTYLKVSLNSDRRINPFDLPKPLNVEELRPGDLLRSAVIDLTGLMKLMLGNMSAAEEALIDKALIDTYATKGITMETPNPSEFDPPTMDDFHSVLSSMEGTTDLAQRLQKYTTGTFAGIFNQRTNVELDNGLIVFSIRDLEDSLRPIAMYIILNYIWNRVRSKLKRRILVIDEAWTMMQHEDSAKFLFGLVKRARKYYLGVTTITQDVEDFIKSPFGKPIVSNSSMQLLLKQSPSVIDGLQKVFNLTEGEKYMLLNSGVGQGLFFAGLQHVAIQVIASYNEDKIVTTNPEQLLRQQSVANAQISETVPSKTGDGGAGEVEVESGPGDAGRDEVGASEEEVAEMEAVG